MPRLPPTPKPQNASVAKDRAGGTVEGRLEGVVEGRVVGWAWLPESPTERVWVSVFVEDEPVGLVPADLKRVDLLAAGVGDGAHGFSVELPASLRGGGHAVRVMAGRSNTQLPAASSFRFGTATNATPGSNGAHSTVEGHLQRPTANGLQIAAANASTERDSPAKHEPSSSGAHEAQLRRELLERYGPPTALAVGLLVNFVLLLVATRHLYFISDDFRFILRKRGWSPDTFLTPMNGHLSLMPVAIFKLMFAVVGIHHSWPFRLVLAALDSACIVLIYHLLAPYAGRAIALVPAYLLLMLGAGTGVTDLVWATQIGFLLSLAAGAAALLCLTRGEREDRRAAILFVISLASSSPSLAICAGALTYLLATHAPRRRFRAVLWPLLLYAAWYLAYGTQGLVISNVPRAPDYLVQIASVSFGALSGLTGPARADGFGGALLMAAIAILAWRFWRGQSFPPLATAGLVSAMTFWLLAALARAQSNNAGSVRYLYPSAMFILIAFGGLLSWRRITTRSVALVVCVLLPIGLGNLEGLAKMVHWRTNVDDQVRVVLGATEVIGQAGKASFKPKPLFVPYLTLGSYLAAVHQLGSPAFSPAEIKAQSEANRALADQTIIDGEQIGLEAPPSLQGATAAPTVEKAEGITIAASTHTSTKCLTATPTAAGATLYLTIDPGQSLYLAPSRQGAVTLYARRLAATYLPRPLGTLPATYGPRGLGFPIDASPLLWHVQLLPTTSITICLGRIP